MKNQTKTILILVILVYIVLALPNAQAAFKAERLLDKQTLNFYLSSTEDRVVGYNHDYYGRYYLIMTFFPAAFTPI
ncbi:MAG TPA: hypothetical protein VFG29_03210 [Syntrophales bacterium]|nr:hypothetical protein [Syntrophales bacterium]